MSPISVRGRWGGVWGCLGVAVLMAAPVAAQSNGTISGQVVDGVTQRPLAGAQISLVDGRQGGLTNASGQYLIVNVPVGEHTVRVEFIGYGSAEQTVTVSPGATAVADFTMTQSAIQMDAIVVTGTAQQTQKRAVGNTVSKIEAESITELAPINNVQELLTARTPGLTLLSSSGQAGASSKIRIRGAGSLAAGLEPVVYVDGVRVRSTTDDGYSTGNGVVQGTNALDFINPSDIESVEVIKGPAAATLYGADAAGGVVQIITKKGRAGSDGIQWNASFEGGISEWALDTPTNYWQCTAANIADPAIYPGCQGVSEGTLLTDDPVKRHPLALRQNSGGPDDYADLNSFNLSARGGGEAFNYYMSFENSDEEGVFYNNFSNRTSGRANFGFTPTEDFSANVSMGYARTHVRMPLNNNSSNSILRNGFRGRPGSSAPWEEGFRGFGPNLSNEYDNQTEAERTTLGLTATYEPWDWFSNRLTLGMDKQDRINQLFYQIDTTGLSPWGATNGTGVVNRYLPVSHFWTVDYAGTLSNDLTEDYASSLSFGMQLTREQFESHEAIGEGLVANKLNLVGAAAVTRADQDFLEQTSLGFFVQEQLTWKDRLYGTVAVRVDDNSAFGNDFSLVVYPKASIAYVISDEDFFDISYVDQLKLRGAWGQAGKAPDPFTADRAYSPDVTIVADNAVNTLTTASYGNPDLKAETGSEIELGFDASLLGGRAGLEFTYYNQSTKDALIEVPDPPSSGFSGTHFTNIGEIKNSGFELLLTGTPVYSRNLTWDATLSLYTNSNELVSFGGALEEISFGAFAQVQKHIEGYPLGGFWAWDVQRDGSGNPVLVDGNVVVESDDPFFVGPQLPTREIGLSNTFTLFGNLRVFTQLDYKGGNYQWCAICSIRNRIDQNTFEVNNPDADPTEVLVWRSLQTKTHIFPADFIKFRELSLSYSLPNEWTSRWGASRTTVTVSGRNLWMWTDYEGTSDPEVTFYSRSDFNQLDYASAPMMRRFTASVSMQF
ncbi:MAG: SusC/RagA family TonB-linked outer membrane protein [Gemmatimonadetes bacterium]|nr:SusC/RagA family TonB-linked outer membrane protein [Gemmatimonadota bacterium]